MEADLRKRYEPVKLHFTSCSTSENHNGSECPIIFIHGLMAMNSTWNRVKCHISNRTRRRVYTVDLRNHGQSEYSEEFTIQHMSADLEQWMEEQSIQRAILVGHSVGGRVAMELALHKPELVEILVIEDALISDAPEQVRLKVVNLLKTVHRYISRLPTYIDEVSVKKMTDNILGKYMPQLSTNGQMSTEMGSVSFCYKEPVTGQFKFHCNMPVLIEFVENPSKTWVDLSGDPIYSGKTLFIFGEHTILNMEEDKELILKHFPQSKFEVLKGSYHVSHVECPDNFIKKVADFILSS